MKRTSDLGLGILVLSLFIFLTCNDDGGGGGGATSRETIGPRGGEITSADGRLTLTFPPGALSGNTEITITEINAEDLPREFDGLVPEFAYVLEPDRIEFAVPVTATFMLDEEPVQDDGSLETELVLLFTSSRGELVVLENLSQEVDGNANMTTISGELSHFSPLVAQQRDNQITAIINGVPDGLPVGGTFNARATVVSGKRDILLGTTDYFDKSLAPIIPQFDSPEQIPTVLDTGNQRIDERFFAYQCSLELTGFYDARIEVAATVFRIAGTIPRRRPFQFTFSFTFSKGVTCTGETPTPTPTPSPTPTPTSTPTPTVVPQPSPGPGPSPSPSPTPTPPPCVMVGGYFGNGGCGVGELTISNITAEGNLIVEDFIDNAGEITFNKTNDPNVFQSVRNDLLIFGLPGHTCTITCGPGDNQFTLECTMPGAVCQEIFTLIQ